MSKKWDLKKYVYILVFCLGVLSPKLLFATTYYSRANGNFMTASTWSFASHTGVAATNAPFQASDILYINHTITIDGSFTFTTLNIDGTSGILIFNSGMTWTVSGTFTNSNTSTTTSWWSSSSAGTLDVSNSSLNSITFYANTTIALGAKIVCPKFTLNSSKTLTLNGTLQTKYSSGTNTVTGTIYNAGTLISYGPLSGAGTLYNYNSGATTGGTLKIENSVSFTSPGKVMGGAIANSINVTGRFSSSQDFGPGNDLSQSTLTVGDGIFITGTCGIVTNPIKVYKVTFNNSGTASSFYVNTADATVYNLDGGYSTGAQAFISVNSGRTLTIEGPAVTSFARSDFFRGTGTFYFASGLDAYTGWTKVDQLVPSASTGGAYEVIYHGNLKIRANGNTVYIGRNTESWAMAYYLTIANNLEIFASPSGGTVTTDLPATSPLKYISVGGTFYYTRDASAGNVAAFTLNLYHRIQRASSPGTVYMGNAASTTNVYYEEAANAAINNFTSGYTTDITTLSIFYGTVNYYGKVAGVNQVAIPVGYYDMTVNRNASTHIVQLKNYSISVRNNLTMTKGLVDINNLNIDLLTTGQIVSENNNDRIYCSGCLTALAEGKILSQSNNLAGSTNYTNIRGMGIGINTTATAPGSTNINRGFRIRSGNELEESVVRYFEIMPTVTSGLNATLIFHYWDAENNNPPLNETLVTLFRDNTGSDYWVDRGGTATAGTGDNYVTLTGIDQFSPWTAGKKTSCIAASLGSATATVSPICPSTTTTVTASGIGGTGSLLTWYTGSGGTGVNLGHNNPLTVGPGTYYAYITATCGSPAEQSVAVAENSLSPITKTDGSRCEAGTILLKAEGAAGSEHYYWYNDPPVGPPFDNGTSTDYTTASLSTTTSFWVSLYNTSTGCESPTKTQVIATVNSLAPVSITITADPPQPFPNPYPIGTVVTLTANVPAQFTNPTYQWSENGADISGATNSTYMATVTGSALDVNCIVKDFNNCLLGGADVVSLPIHLLTFNAKVNQDKDVDVYWETASETNNAFFTIERSNDGVEFLPIANTDGAGNSNSNLKYYYTDEDPFPGTSYYRLMQTDFDGKFEIFDPVTVTMNSDDDFVFDLYPNPATKVLYITFKNTVENATFEISDLPGNKIVTQTLEKSSHLKKISLDLSNYKKGIYFVKVTSSGSTSVKKLVLQ